MFGTSTSIEERLEKKARDMGLEMACSIENSLPDRVIDDNKDKQEGCVYLHEILFYFIYENHSTAYVNTPNIGRKIVERLREYVFVTNRRVYLNIITTANILSSCKELEEFLRNQTVLNTAFIIDVFSDSMMFSCFNQAKYCPKISRYNIDDNLSRSMKTKCLKILETDPLMRWYGFREGDLVKTHSTDLIPNSQIYLVIKPHQEDVKIYNEAEILNVVPTRCICSAHDRGAGSRRMCCINSQKSIQNV